MRKSCLWNSHIRKQINKQTNMQYNLMVQTNQWTVSILKSSMRVFEGVSNWNCLEALIERRKERGKESRQRILIMPEVLDKIVCVLEEVEKDPKDELANSTLCERYKRWVKDKTRHMIWIILEILSSERKILNDKKWGKRKNDVTEVSSLTSS